MVVYICQCQFPNSSHPLFSPWCPHACSPSYISTCLRSLRQSSSQPSSLSATEAGRAGSLQAAGTRKRNCLLWLTRGRAALWYLHKAMVWSLKGMWAVIPGGGEGAAPRELDHRIPCQGMWPLKLSAASLVCLETENAWAPVLIRSARISASKLLSVITPDSLTRHCIVLHSFQGVFFIFLLYSSTFSKGCLWLLAMKTKSPLATF